ncbi:MAG: prolipoprotein diacylglyceryl transferase [Oscillospiraceae bacterium]|nr:prolipoprotein diacylglyceryl transferase [Oscillospiraceae bacterium]
MTDFFNNLFQQTTRLYMIGGVLLNLLPAFWLHYSRRMNAKLDQPAPRGWLTMLHQAIEPKAISGKQRKLAHGKKMQRAPRYGTFTSRNRRKRIAAVLRTLDVWLREKLSLLPSATLERRTNWFILLFVTWLVPAFTRWVLTGRFTELYHGLRNSPELTAQESTQLLLLFSSLLLIAVVALTPLFFLKRNREFHWDVFAIFMLLHTFFHKMRCYWWNCCFGFVWEGGRYSSLIGAEVFPLQLLEAGGSLLLTVVCILFVIYSKHYKPGRGMSLALIFYAIPRFFWDFLRYNETVRTAELDGLFGLTMGQTVSILAVVLAVIWWFALPLERKIMSHFDSGLRRVAIWLYFRPRLHPVLSKLFSWHDDIAALKEARRT